MGVLFVVYQASRLLGGQDAEAALEHARQMLALQGWLGLPTEQVVQDLVLAVQPFVLAANSYYVAAHLPLMGGTLLWLLLRRPAVYRRTRAALVSSTGLALAVYLLVPVAPPRMLPGFVDTAALHGPSVYGDPGSAGLANQYAALPSLHVGWAVLVALACVAAGSSRWRWLWIAHPALTVVVVVATANHFWLDAVTGALLVLGAWWVAPHVCGAHWSDVTRAPSVRRGRPAGAPAG
jgi:hypothetical protein